MHSHTVSGATPSVSGDWLAGRRLDAVIAVLSLWMIAGIFLDGRAHAMGVPESFFSLEHAAFYTAFVALAVVFGLVVRREYARTGNWRTSIPEEHRLSLLGVVVFGLGGLADLGWHLAFGIESDVEALLSPTHLLLVAGALLLVSTPLRRAWRDGIGAGWREQATTILSASLVLAMLSFITVYGTPFNGRSLAIPTWVAADIGPMHGRVFDYTLLEMGVLSVMFQTVVMMGVLLLLVARFGDRLAFGAFTVMLTVTGLGIAAFMGGFFLLPAMIGAGVVADALYRVLRPSTTNLRAVRIFAFAVPFVTYAGFFALYAAARGMPWTIHVWTGAIVLAAVTGYLVSLLVFTPGIPSESSGGERADSV